MINITPAFDILTPHMHPGAADEWISALTPCMQSAGITTPKRVAMFLGQCAVESGGFQRLSEDLYYTTPERIHEIYPLQFPTVADAAPFVCVPETLANYVYAARDGNGDPESGDGWRFRGHGIIQLTGRLTYQDFAHAVGMDVERVPDWMTTPAGAARAAAWYWGWAHHGVLNHLADAWDIKGATKIINGGYGELHARIAACSQALAALSAPVVVAHKTEPVTADDLNAKEFATITAPAGVPVTTET